MCIDRQILEKIHTTNQSLNSKIGNQDFQFPKSGSVLPQDDSIETRKTGCQTNNPLLR